MKSFTHHLVTVLSLASIISTSPALASHRPDQTRFPNEGSIKYDGNSFAQAFFYWHNVGGWKSTKVFYDPSGIPITQPRPGLEFDIALSIGTYFDNCTTWTNLPFRNYDDCPTAGVSEPSGSGKNFGLGTFDAYNIKNNTWYRGDWNFTGGSVNALDTNFNLTWQEVERNLCGYGPDNIWCMGGVPGSGNAGSLRSGYWRDGTSYYGKWYY